MRISDWSSDVCSSDLTVGQGSGRFAGLVLGRLDAVVGSRAAGDRDLAGLHGLGDDAPERDREQTVLEAGIAGLDEVRQLEAPLECTRRDAAVPIFPLAVVLGRSEEHPSELQYLMRLL